MEKAGVIAAEAAGALIVAGSFVISAMPTLGLLLAIIWYAINILNSAQGKAAAARLKAAFYVFRRVNKKQAQAVTAMMQSDTRVVVATQADAPVVIEPKGQGNDGISA